MLPSLADNRMKVGRVIRAAHERTGSNVLKSFLARDLTIKIELLRRDEFHHRQMIRRRAQIPAHCQNLAADFAQIVHRLENLRLGFPEAERDPAFLYAPASPRRPFLPPSHHLPPKLF